MIFNFLKNILQLFGIFLSLFKKYFTIIWEFFAVHFFILHDSFGNFFIPYFDALLRGNDSSQVLIPHPPPPDSKLPFNPNLSFPKPFLFLGSLSWNIPTKRPERGERIQLPTRPGSGKEALENEEIWGFVGFPCWGRSKAVSQGALSWDQGPNSAWIILGMLWRRCRQLFAPVVMDN